jgi:hypothetical protein
VLFVEAFLSMGCDDRSSRVRSFSKPTVTPSQNRIVDWDHVSNQDVRHVLRYEAGFAKGRSSQGEHKLAFPCWFLLLACIRGLPLEIFIVRLSIKLFSRRLRIGFSVIFSASGLLFFSSFPVFF